MEDEVLEPKCKSLEEFKTDYENFARQQIRIEGVLAYIAGEIKKLTGNS